MNRGPAKNSPFRAACLVGAAVITVGVEATNVINVSILLKDDNYAAVAERAGISAYLSDDANGDSLTASAPSGGIVIGTNGLLIPQVTNKAFSLTSESNGSIDLNITEAGTPTFYLVLVMPDGHLVVSGAITFA